MLTYNTGYEIKYMPRSSDGKIVEFGVVLDEILRERGWNQTLLSAATDPEVSQGQISNYRYGRRNPKPETIEVIATALTPEHLKEDGKERYRAQVLNRLRHAAGLRTGTTVDVEAIEVQYEAILDELRSASYSGGLDSRDVSEVAEIIRLKAQRKLERQGRD